MKTTIELEDDLLRQAKAAALEEGITFKQLLTQALRSRLATRAEATPVWHRLFGGLADLRAETRRVERRIAEEFEQVEPGEES